MDSLDTKKVSIEPQISKKAVAADGFCGKHPLPDRIGSPVRSPFSAPQCPALFRLALELDVCQSTLLKVAVLPTRENPMKPRIFRVLPRSSSHSFPW